MSPERQPSIRRSTAFALFVLAMVFALGANLSARYFGDNPTLQESTSVQRYSPVQEWQKLNGDAQVWAPPALTVLTRNFCVVARIALPEPNVASSIPENSLYNRPPPFHS